ncbi:MAG: hypothetical protein WC712_13675 [Candidatus Brocadiia bacterium]
MRKSFALAPVFLAIAVVLSGCSASSNGGSASNSPVGLLSWNTPIEIAPNAKHFSSKLRFDGNLGLAFYSPLGHAIFYEEFNLAGKRLSRVKVLSDLDSCAGLALGISYCDRPVISFFKYSDHHIYLLCHEDKSLPGWVTAPGWTIRALDGSTESWYASAWDTIENGNMIVAYFDTRADKVKVQCMGGTSLPWIETIPYDGKPMLFLSIAVRPGDGEPVVAFHDRNKKALVFASRKVGVWTTEVVDASGDAGDFCKVRVAPLGDIFIAYQDLTKKYCPVTKLAHKTADKWTIETVDTKVSGYNLDMALDTKQRPLILSAQHSFVFSSQDARFRCARFSGTAWETNTIPNPTDIEGDINIHITPSGKPVVFFICAAQIFFIASSAASKAGHGPVAGENLEVTEEEWQENGPGTEGDILVQFEDGSVMLVAFIPERLAELGFTPMQAQRAYLEASAAAQCKNAEETRALVVKLGKKRVKLATIADIFENMGD